MDRWGVHGIQITFGVGILLWLLTTSVIIVCSLSFSYCVKSIILCIGDWIVTPFLVVNYILIGVCSIYTAVQLASLILSITPKVFAATLVGLFGAIVGAKKETVNGYDIIDGDSGKKIDDTHYVSAKTGTVFECQFEGYGKTWIDTGRSV